MKARGILILTQRKPENCPLQVESNFFPIRIIMRETGQPKIHPKSNISNSHHDPSRLPWLSHKNTPQEDNKYIVYNILLLAWGMNEFNNYYIICHFSGTEINICCCCIEFLLRWTWPEFNIRVILILPPNSPFQSSKWVPNVILH